MYLRMRFLSPAGQHGPEYLHHLPATFLLISSRHAERKIRPCHGKHIAASGELLTSCLNLVTEPGIMLPFNGLAHKIPELTESHYGPCFCSGHKSILQFSVDS